MQVKSLVCYVSVFCAYAVCKDRVPKGICSSAEPSHLLRGAFALSNSAESLSEPLQPSPCESYCSHGSGAYPYLLLRDRSRGGGLRTPGTLNTEREAFSDYEHER